MSEHADNCPAHDSLHCDCPAGKLLPPVENKISPAMERAAGPLSKVMEAIDAYRDVRENADKEFEAVVNPKDKWGLAKPGISSIPPVALAMLGQAMAEGERKYGLTNWRGTKVTARLYYEAAQRHMMAWLDGETLDRATGIPHLALAMADLSIILDGTHYGKLVDDRTPHPGSFPDWLEENTAVKDPNARTV